MTCLACWQPLARAAAVFCTARCAVAWRQQEGHYRRTVPAEVAAAYRALIRGDILPPRVAWAFSAWWVEHVASPHLARHPFGRP